MRFRKLRFALSAACGIAATLLCGLWLRSYERMDWLGVHCEERSFTAWSGTGAINFSTNGREAAHWDFYVRSRGRQPDDGRLNALTFIWNTDVNLLVLVVPHWFLAAILILVAAALPLRFSLQTLLVATTLITLLMGAAVWTAA